MIDVLVPVLGRPQNAQPLADSLAANTSSRYTLTFLVTPDDAAEIAACAATGAGVLPVTTTGGDYSGKINCGFRATSFPFVLCAADDVEFSPEWDTIALACARTSGCGVIGTNDLANRAVMQGVFSTHPLVSRSYIMRHGGSLDGPGMVYHEGYDHNYPDRELAGLAQYRNEWAFAIESKVIHRHPGWNNPKADATYKKGARHFQRDHKLFLQRSFGWNHVGLVPQEQRAVRSMRPVPGILAP